ncbi:MAG: hypothetical protein ACRER2_13060 [Methylococcales bacterium]
MSKWQTGLATLGQIVYPNLWPGIDLVQWPNFYGSIGIAQDLPETPARLSLPSHSGHVCAGLFRPSLVCGYPVIKTPCRLPPYSRVSRMA